jgi:hypothetical protein
MVNASRDLLGTGLACDVLSAYRHDLERTPDVVAFGPHDARWLRIALRVEQLTSQPGAGRAGGLKRLGAHPTLRGTPLLALTERMEAAGALMLAFATLAYARRVWERTDAASAGMAIFRQARICRMSGATAAAENYYAYLLAYATRHRLPELRGRALIGRGILRTLEGNPSAGRRWYVLARRVSANHPVAAAVSYHGEMNAALAMHDYSGATVAGWRALETRSLGAYDEAGVLVNLASLALQAGRPHAALATVRRAIRRCAHHRVRLGAFAKGALAAAALDRPALVEAFAARLVGVAARIAVPFEELEARSELAEAFALVGDRTRARRLARSVQAEASQHGFASVMARCDRVLHDAPAAALLALSPSARRVMAELEPAA